MLLSHSQYAEDLGSGFSSDVESKYKKMYEEDINLFAAFSKKERDQRYKELGLRDKITLRSGCFLLGNKMQIILQLGTEQMLVLCSFHQVENHIPMVPQV
ncbi:hypothetical protein R3W88_010208 [Solanum pinnatisectum]|uniref:CASP C-terminal domain-containing protein n=1 Tax=Solanum pinnatisectum TaxID=50273 RepID=A0AAV9MF30_9SOLN|nr:hypothetical protein R3W88_010208 [Solanum pinnatisectum]